MVFQSYIQNIQSDPDIEIHLEDTFISIPFSATFFFLNSYIWGYLVFFICIHIICDKVVINMYFFMPACHVRARYFEACTLEGVLTFLYEASPLYVVWLLSGWSPRGMIGHILSLLIRRKNKYNKTDIRDPICKWVHYYMRISADITYIRFPSFYIPLYFHHCQLIYQSSWKFFCVYFKMQ